MKIPADLLTGYQRFRDNRYSREHRHYRQIAEGQRPHTMVIGCADSRVDPATIFDARPGELFVVRNIAALVPPLEETGTYHGTSAAIEFAVTALEVKRIVVLGHGLCGGVAASLAAADKRPVGKFIGPWVEMLSPIRDELLERTPSSHGETRQKALERLAIQQSLNNLMSFPFVSDAVDQASLQLDGAWFSIAEGKLQWLDWDTGTFGDVEPIAARAPSGSG
ncbi:MAG: carbonic anhydrase [Alphaproteobacteria bacterium]|nr:carbonic anhydrase [Alphaproteobacteria bacterium]